jgi:uncharacterized membrane protein
VRPTLPDFLLAAAAAVAVAAISLGWTLALAPAHPAPVRTIPEHTTTEAIR